MQGKRTAVIRIDADGNEIRYITISDAARKNYVDRSAIVSACRTGGRCAGFRWRKENNDMSGFAGRLSNLRGQLGISAAELSGRCGLSYSMVQKYESEQRSPSAENLAVLADALGVTMDELWRGA